MPAITQAARDYDKAMQQMQYDKAMKSQLELQKLQFDVAKAREESDMSTAIGRSSKAADVAAFLEQEKQKEFGIPIGEQMASKMVAQGGPSILEATKMQGQLDVEARARQARVDAAKNYLAGEKSLLPTADINLGGVKRTVLAEEVGTAGVDVYSRIYRTQVPQVAATYEAEGQSRDNAIKMASADVRSKLTGAVSSGKIPLIAANGNPLFITVPQAIQLLDSDITPQFMKNQLKDALEGKVEPQAASWIKTRLGR
ncbi:MAG: hypothetical protein EBU08_15025 [Micrococcales bacterium]|nr:hypothetical protein [Micrococcales bacterium]